MSDSQEKEGIFFTSLLLEEMWLQNCIAGLIALALLLSQRFTNFDASSFISTKEPSNVYGALASIYGALLGFVITAAAIVISSLGSPYLAVVRRSQHFHKLWTIFFSTSKFLGIATLFSLACMIDSLRESIGALSIFISFGLCAGSILRIGSCLWILESVVELQTQDD